MTLTFRKPLITVGKSWRFFLLLRRVYNTYTVYIEENRTVRERKLRMFKAFLNLGGKVI